MPLVDYASSDEDSCDESEVSSRKEEDQNDKKRTVESAEVKDNTNSDGGELFSSLPKPRKSFSFLEDDNKLSKLLLNKQSITPGKKENVKIAVPSVSEFDVEEPSPKKLKPSSKGAGLFSILPPPKNNVVKASNTNLVPHPVSQKQLKQSVKKAVATKLMKSTEPDDDDDDDGAVGSSFFGSSLAEQHSNSKLDEISNGNVSFDNRAVSGNPYAVNNFNMAEQNTNRSLLLKSDEDRPIYPANPPQESETVSADDNPLDLDEKALQILCGNKKKRHQMPMNIIDLSSEEVLPDSKEWLLKQFTEEKGVRSHSHKKSHGPSSMSRRKHQITYLAYQAKEMELELKNQWANNRMTRKQTQSKYGF